MDVILYMKIESNKVHPISASFVKLFVCKFKKKTGFYRCQDLQFVCCCFRKNGKVFFGLVLTKSFHPHGLIMGLGII